MASPYAGASALKYGDVNKETTSPSEIKGLINNKLFLFIFIYDYIKYMMNIEKQIIYF